MGVIICLPLFGPPGRELEEGAALKGQPLRNLAAELHDRLHKAADTLDKLTAAGWRTQLAMYDVLLSQPGVETRAEAVRRLTALGIDTEELMILEEEVEEELGAGP